MAKENNLDRIYDKLLSEKTKEFSEKVILTIAIIGFIIHLCLIFLVDFNIINLKSKLFDNPIAATYTPFSFILLYEVYLLIYYLPKSITTYIGKQYEIITLIIIRRLFKDLSSLELSSEWFEIKDDLQFTYDILASLILFYLLYLFYRLNKKENFGKIDSAMTESIYRFIDFKKIIAACLVPIFLIIATYTFASWGIGIVYPEAQIATSFKNINNIFFDEFFTILIIVDVILLLASFFYTDKFYKVIRNSGFVISTILIRLSFSVDGLVNTLLIVSAICFGLLILLIHNQFEKDLKAEKL